MSRSLDIEIGELAADEKSAAVGVLARGMRDNPGHVAVFGPDPAHRSRRLRSMFQGVLGSIPPPIVARRLGWVVGVCGLVPPALPHFSSVRGLVRMVPFAVAGPASALRGARWIRAWQRVHPTDPHWHLGPVAVDAPLQHMGIGTRMLDAFCDRVDATGSRAYLETDKPENVVFYKRFGFEVTEQQTVLGTPNWFMWREGRP